MDKHIISNNQLNEIQSSINNIETYASTADKLPTRSEVLDIYSWQSRTITYSSTTTYTINPGGAPWNYLFIYQLEPTSNVFLFPSALLLGKTNSGTFTLSMHAYSLGSTPLKKDTISVTFNGATGDITLSKTASGTYNLGYMTFK